MALKVDDKYRTDLSRIPGGSSVTIVMNDGRQFIYDKIKNMRAYLSRTLRNVEVKHAILEGEIVTVRDL